MVLPEEQQSEKPPPSSIEKLFRLLLNLLAGPKLEESDFDVNPLRRSNPGNDGWLAIPADDIDHRAKCLISCNLQLYKDYFLQSAAYLTTRDLQNPESLAVLETDTRRLHICERCGNTIVPESHAQHVSSAAQTPEVVTHRALTNDEIKMLRPDRGSILQKLRNQPWAMWQLMLLCGLGAMVQGMDEAAINGAQVYYQLAYGFQSNDRRIGILNGAPYACCFVSCWLSWPLNKYLGRRGTIFVAALASFAFALLQAFANDWKMMFVWRFLLGLGIGPKSATIPVYASEVAPAEIRGALVMLWQLCTALGIMFGYLCGVAFATVGEGNTALFQRPPCDNTEMLLSLPCSLNWRLMVGSPMVAPIILAMYILLQPESPRWLMAKAHKIERSNENRKNRNERQSEQNRKPESELGLENIDLEPVYLSLIRLRGGNKLKAAKDMLIIDVLLWAQNDTAKLQPKTSETVERNITRSIRDKIESQFDKAWRDLRTLFTQQRNRNAFLASIIVMFLQQFCGINILIYYSTLVLFQTVDNGPPELWGKVPKFIVLSTVVGVMNFIFGVPALFVIDERGRRPLLLRTFPLLGFFALVVAMGNVDALKDSIARTVLIFTGMIMFVIVYSPGEGPVPFVYASESFPQDVRDVGMSVVTSMNWAFNFLVAALYPDMASSMKLYGTFAFYSAWCFIGFILVLLFVPETCRQELEKLDEVFDESLGNVAFRHAKEFCTAVSEKWTEIVNWISHRRQGEVSTPGTSRALSTLSKVNSNSVTHALRATNNQEMQPIRTIPPPKPF